MRRGLSILAAVFAAAQAGAGDDDLSRYNSDLASCVAAAQSIERQLACIGAGSQRCMEGEEAGFSTQGMAACTQAETRAWDALLNAEYQKTMAWARSMDAADADLFPEFALRAGALRDAQRAWIAYRDAECGYAYAQWGPGSMRVISGSGCLLQMTAERTIELIAKREMQQ